LLFVIFLGVEKIALATRNKCYSHGHSADDLFMFVWLCAIVL